MGKAASSKGQMATSGSKGRQDRQNTGRKMLPPGPTRLATPWTTADEWKMNRRENGGWVPNGGLPGEVSQAARSVRQHDPSVPKLHTEDPAPFCFWSFFLTVLLSFGETIWGLRAPKGSGSLGQQLCHTSTAVPRSRGCHPFYR